MISLRSKVLLCPRKFQQPNLTRPTQSQAEASRDRSPRRQKQEPKGKILEPDNLLTQELNQVARWPRLVAPGGGLGAMAIVAIGQRPAVSHNTNKRFCLPRGQKGRLLT